MSTQPAEPEPLAFSVVRGNPDEAELAAVWAALSAHPTASAEQPAPLADPATGWSAYWRAVRAPLPRGPGGWRASSRPD